MPARRRFAALAAAALLPIAMVVSSASVTAGGATIVEYPGPDCPHDATHGLQGCIDSVLPGSTVVLVSEIIDEDADITKDLTLKALDRSLQPLLGSLSIRTTGSDPLRVTVEDIRFADQVQVRLSQGSDHDVRLRRLGVGTGSNGTRGLYVTAGACQRDRGGQLYPQLRW